MTSKDKLEDPVSYQKSIEEICAAYGQAHQLELDGTHVVCCDECTGIQAMERKHATLAAVQGQIERREFEYIRHGTLCLIANFFVATGLVIYSTISPTRTEEDFVAHIRQTVENNPRAKWVFVVDQLNTHVSEKLVLLVAELCGLDMDLGVKGKRGILKSRKTRREFLSDTSHAIRFVYTPRHCSWMNQVEIWFSILARRLLRRTNFKSLDDLRSQIDAFIAYFNATLAKPFRWTYTGRPLVA